MAPLISVEGNDHGSVLYSTCAHRLGRSFLSNAEVPEPDVSCRADEVS